MIVTIESLCVKCSCWVRNIISQSSWEITWSAVKRSVKPNVPDKTKKKKHKKKSNNYASSLVLLFTNFRQAKQRLFFAKSTSRLNLFVEVGKNCYNHLLFTVSRFCRQHYEWSAMQLVRVVPIAWMTRCNVCMRYGLHIALVLHAHRLESSKGESRSL